MKGEIREREKERMAGNTEETRDSHFDVEKLRLEERRDLKDEGREKKKPERLSPNVKR